MNRGKISFGKIGFNLGGTKLVAPSPADPRNESTGDTTSTTNVGFGSFGQTPAEKKDNEKKVEHEDKMEAMMGFSGFGKKSRNFDMDKLLEETRVTAIERNRENLKKLELSLESQETLPSHQSSTNSNDEDNDDDFIGPPLPPDKIPIPKEDESDGENDSDDEYKLPISHELLLEHGTRAVSAIAVDPSGTRLVSGGIDYDVKYFDFQGMDQSREAFRSFCPADGYPINSVEYSCTGDKVLVVPGSQQAKVYDRDGLELFECARGDMYLHDKAKTKGHVSGLTCGTWHPKDKEEFMTAARDGTCRLWHTEHSGSQRHVIKARASNGLKTIPTTCAFNRDGLLVACACDDGSIQMWDHRKNFVNVMINIKNAHTKGSETSSLTFAYDNRGFATRGGDDTLKLWDIRNPKQAVKTATDLFNRFGMTNCVFSPNDQILVTGTSLNRGETSGKLVMLDRNTFNVVKELEVGTSHVIKVIWHPRLNQLMIGSGDGKVRLLYEPELSHNGAILIATKHKKRVKQAEVVVSQQVITPHALPMFREERHKSTRKLEERDRKDPVKSRQPELPVGKAGSGGRVSAGGSTLSSYIIRNMGLRNKVHEEGDPREALLKYAKEAAENPYWVTPAYNKNQPNPVFQEQQEMGSKDEQDPSEPPTKKIKE